MDAEFIDTNKYKVEGSVGKGRWSTIPWVVIMDKTMTKSPTKGYYISILFKNDLSGFYMSLNQGWTEFKNQREDEGQTLKHIKKEIALISDYWRYELKADSSRFSAFELDLTVENSSSDLPEGYESGNIFSKYYPMNSLPNDEEFILDLNGMLALYNELIGNIPDTYLRKNKEILNEIDKSIPVGKLNVDFDPYSFEKIESEITYERNPNRFNGIKQDFEKSNRKKSDLGLKGEKWVLEYEEYKLKKANIFSEKIKSVHSSIEEGDGLGYDIKSYDEKGNQILIEVKTTSSNETTPFFITENELDRSRVDADKFQLYRVSNFNNDGNVKSEIYKGDLSKQRFSLQPLSYVTVACLDDKSD